MKPHPRFLRYFQTIVERKEKTMKKGFNLWSILLLVGILCGMFAYPAFSATANPSPSSPGYTPVVLPIMGTYSSTQTVMKWKAPTGYRVVHASVFARAVSGSTPTLTVDVLTGSTSVLSTPVTVTAGTITDAVLATSPVLADEGTVNVNFTKGGTYTSGQGWKDITLFMLLKRR
jgi:hypothetical protein